MAQAEHSGGDGNARENSQLRGPTCVLRLRKRWDARAAAASVRAQALRVEAGCDVTARGSPGDTAAALGGSVQLDYGTRGRLRVKHGYMRKGWGNGLSGPTFVSYEKDTSVGTVSVEAGRASISSSITDPYKLLKLNIDTELQMDGIIPRAPRYTRIDPQPQDKRLIAAGAGIVAASRMPVKLRRLCTSGTGNCALELAMSMRAPSMRTLKGGELCLLEVNPVVYLDALQLFPTLPSEQAEQHGQVKN